MVKHFLYFRFSFYWLKYWTRNTWKNPLIRGKHKFLMFLKLILKYNQQWWSYACMYVCVYVYMYIYTHIYIYTNNTHTDTYTPRHICDEYWKFSVYCSTQLAKCTLLEPLLFRQWLQSVQNHPIWPLQCTTADTSLAEVNSLYLALAGHSFRFLCKIEILFPLACTWVHPL